MIIAAIVIATVYLLSLLLRITLSLSYVHRLPATPSNTLAANSLSVIQPILSGDPNLESCLRSTVEQLQDQHSIWLIDTNDPLANRITTALQNQFPNTRIQILSCTPSPDTVNPKLWKLQSAIKYIQTPYFCILDDDTTLNAHSAEKLIEASANHTVATGLPYYQDDGRCISGLLAQFVNNNSIFTYMGTSRLLKPFTLNGMGYVMKREMISQHNLFSPILNELTDDFSLATLIRQHKGSIHQSNAPLCVRTSVESLKKYMQIMHRWYVFTMLLLKRQSCTVAMLIFLLHGLPPLLLWSLLILALFRGNPQGGILLAGVLVIRGSLFTLLLRHFFTPGLHRPILSVVSELMQPIHLIHALFCRTIRWRTHLYHVHDVNDFSER